MPLLFHRAWQEPQFAFGSLLDHISFGEKIVRLIMLRKD